MTETRPPTILSVMSVTLRAEPKSSDTKSKPCRASSSPNRSARVWPLAYLASMRAARHLSASRRNCAVTSRSSRPAPRIKRPKRASTSKRLARTLRRPCRAILSQWRKSSREPRRSARQPPSPRRETVPAISLPAIWSRSMSMRSIRFPSGIMAIASLPSSPGAFSSNWRSLVTRSSLRSATKAAVAGAPGAFCQPASATASAALRRSRRVTTSARPPPKPR